MMAGTKTALTTKLLMEIGTLQNKVKFLVVYALTYCNGKWMDGNNFTFFILIPLYKFL